MKNSKKTSILCVHQSNELYGSDVMFVQSVRALRERFPDAAIDVVIPSSGPIETLLRKYSNKITYKPIWVLRKSNFKSLSAIEHIWLLPESVLKAAILMKRYDTVYINTIVVINFLMAAIISGTATVTHIHEIVPGLPGRLFSVLVRKASHAIITNSHATACAYRLNKEPDTHIVWNGTTQPAHITLPETDNKNPLKILMPGRINAWKGQDILVEALALMGKDKLSRMDIRIVGDVYKGQDHFREQLTGRIKKYGLESYVKLLGFRTDMKNMYQWCDVVIIPSKKPEPFGLVAIEAMSNARPAIASAIGGLKEIIIHEQTGWLVPPENPEAIAAILTTLVDKREYIARNGSKARNRVLSFFTNKAYRKKFSDIFGRLPSTD